MGRSHWLGWAFGDALPEMQELGVWCFGAAASLFRVEASARHWMVGVGGG